MKLVTSEEMRALEQAAERAGTPTSALMENAGQAVAEAVLEEMGGIRARRIAVLVGPGNNGGDGLVAARHFYDSGQDVFVYLVAPRPDPDPNLEALVSRDVDIARAGEPGAEARLDEVLERADAVVDAILGTGRSRPLEGPIAATLDRLRHRRALLFAVDLPTGVDADTGAVDDHAVAADVTFALGFSKVGLHTLPGSQHAGRVVVLDIGLPADAATALTVDLLTPEWVRERLPPRWAGGNKGTFGRVLVVAGSERFTGAAALCAIGALRAGAGLVALAAIPAVRAAIAALVPETTYIILPEDEGAIAATAASVVARELPAFDALLVGPGLGQTAGVRGLVRDLVTSGALSGAKVVLDADALNVLSMERAWWERLDAEAVLTPHPGELSRLTGESIADLQQERIAAARRCARDWRLSVVMKGAHSVIADPSGTTLVSPFATAALATGGTGDVLAGAIAGYLAQGLSALDAAGLGVFVHGAAAELLRDDYGESGILASELGAAMARSAAELRRGG